VQDNKKRRSAAAGGASPARFEEETAELDRDRNDLEETGTPRVWTRQGYPGRTFGARIQSCGFERQRLFGDTEAVAVRRGHKLGRRLRTVDGFLKARHVAVVGRGQQEDPVDTWLRKHGVERQIALTVPSYLQALHVAARTELVAFIPKRLIEALAGLLSLAMVPSPIDPGTYEEFMFHPVRATADPGSMWLRTHVLRVGRALNR
jgi:DNA-binding transcriptional LysR family regulator